MKKLLLLPLLLMLACNEPQVKLEAPKEDTIKVDTLKVDTLKVDSTQKLHKI